MKYIPVVELFLMPQAQAVLVSKLVSKPVYVVV